MIQEDLTAVSEISIPVSFPPCSKNANFRCEFASECPLGTDAHSMGTNPRPQLGHSSHSCEMNQQARRATVILSMKVGAKNNQTAKRTLIGFIMGGLNAIFNRKKKKPKQKTPKESGARTKGWQCSKQMREQGLSKTKQLMKAMKMDMTTKPKKILGKISGSSGDLGTDKASQSTIDRYTPYWSTLRDFCFLVGDYKSAMILCRDDCPTNPFPISVQTAVHCMRFCVMEEGSSLLDKDTNEPVQDINGNAIKCVGIWRAASTLKGYQSALSKICSHYDTTKGEYFKPCGACSRATAGCGCAVHVDKPSLLHCGSVTKDEDFLKAMVSLLEYVEETYDGKTTFQLMPSMLRAIRNALLVANDKYSLMVWTLMIVGIKLFGRIDEVITMKVEDFPPDYFAIKDNNVKALATEIKGKCDKETHTMAIWDDTECPEFSAARALIVWVAVSGITEGYLFPSRAFVCGPLCGKQPASNHVAYTTLLDHLKGLVENTCNIDESAMDNTFIGTHLLRKTGYLLMAWGFRQLKESVTDVDIANVGLSTRHKDIGCMATYLRDSTTLKHLLDSMNPNDETEFVGTWKPIHISTSMHWKAMSSKIDTNKRCLPQVAAWYIRDVIQIAPYLNHATIHDKVCKFQPSLDAHEKFEQLVQKVPEEYRAELRRMNQLLIQNAARTAANAVMPAVAVTPSPEGKKRSAAAEPNSKSANKKPTLIVEFTQDYQQLFKSCPSKLEGVKILFKAIGEVEAANSKGIRGFAGEGVRRWVSRADAVVRCARNCYEGRPEAFVAAQGSFSISRFSGCGNESCPVKQKKK